MDRSVDVAIIGAGVAGLEAARVLHDHAVDFVVLEARERAGGRIFTLHDDSLPVPIELGAEFVHGSAPELREVAREARVAVADNSGERWQSIGGRLRPINDFWSQLDIVMSKLRTRGEDRSFEQFLKSWPVARRHAHARSLALEYVKGFHAADPARVSERALAEGGSPSGDASEQRIGRINGGYDAVPRWIAHDIGNRVRFGSIVTAVRWERNAVQIEVQDPNGTSTSAVEARVAIVTLPLGVLHAAPGEPGAVMFDPPLNAHIQSALGGMEMGVVIRVSLRLTERFWTTERFVSRTKNDDIDRLAFLQSPDEDFPVWWTSYPLAAPMLVAWCGGPRARELASLGEEEIVDRSIAALARQFGLTRRTARQTVTAAWIHNWMLDPYSRGAYSYMVVGGNESPAKMARPLQRTLFFAGEATDADGRTGTVHGAIATGRRAAKQVLRVL